MKKPAHRTELLSSQDLCHLLGISGLPRLLKLAEVRHVLGISMKTLQRRIDAGKLVVVRDGRVVRVTPGDLARYIAARRS